MSDAASATQQITLARDLDELARLTPWITGIAEAGGWSSALRFAVELCLEEAVSNIIRHGVLSHGRPEIRIALSEAEGRVTLAIEDDGQAFDPTQCAPPVPPASLAEAKPGGLGVHFLRAFAASLDYARVGSSNRLVMQFDHP